MKYDSSHITEVCFCWNSFSHLVQAALHALIFFFLFFRESCRRSDPAKKKEPEHTHLPPPSSPIQDNQLINAWKANKLLFLVWCNRIYRGISSRCPALNISWVQHWFQSQIRWNNHVPACYLHVSNDSLEKPPQRAALPLHHCLHLQRCERKLQALSLGAPVVHKWSNRKKTNNKTRCW